MTPSLRERLNRLQDDNGYMLECRVVDQILLAVKEELPPKEPSPNLNVHIGWNSAIEEMERRLE